MCLQASEEIALLQRELAQRRAMEAALRAAAEAAILEQQEQERWDTGQRGRRIGRWHGQRILGWLCVGVR